MNWIQNLYETYDNCQSMIGIGPDEGKLLLPICHTAQNAHIEIVIDGNGNFKKARVIPKDEARTIIPCTESSGGRSGKKPQCHPLCDNLQYVAGDFTKYGGEVTSGFAKNPIEPFDNYIALLSDWCKSDFSHPKAIAILKYVKKKRVIKDLIDQQILINGANKKLITDWDKKKNKVIPEILKVTSSQGDAFVRWEIVIPGKYDTKVWKDKSLWKSWYEYYSTTKKEKILCYVSGKELYSTDQHPRNIRRPGDGAKLISSNDGVGYTFRGRFTDKEGRQACGVGFEVTQKAHNALRWLISRQGYRHDLQAIVAWATSGAEIPDPLADPYSFIGDELSSDQHASTATAQALALKLKNRIAGYGKKLGNTSNVVVMGIDSATTGRMAITYYRELTGSDFLHRIDQWHETCAWIHNYHGKEVEDSKTGKKKKIYLPFVGAPSPTDITEAAYATKVNGRLHVDDKLRNATVERILPCIIDGQPIPKDIVESVVRRASHRVGLGIWDWNKTLSIACALYKKYHPKEDYNMALDENRKTRDYLYGRLLAIADRLEEVALYKAKEKRATNAARYMQQFAQRPYRTWNQIHSSLTPHILRLGGAIFYKNLIGEVKCLFDPIEDFTNDNPLTGEYLLGYYCQRKKLWEKAKDVLPPQEEDGDNDISEE